MAIITTLITGALTGLIISTTGVGGGVIVLPILTYLYGMNALMAVATANLLSMLMKVASSWLHYKLGNIPLRRAMIVLGIMLPATFGASLLVTWLASVPAWQAITEKSINLLVVAAILFSLWLFIQRMFFPPPLPADTAETPMSVRELLLPGITAGVVLGATGVGGGIVVLPILLRYAKMDIRQAIGTSIFVTTLLSGSSAIAYMQDGHTDVRLALWLFAGSLLSMPLTKILLTRMPDRAFQYATLILILCSAVMMTLNLF
ncbi:sulfite exporter TauE/SafE family protein [Morganella morganii subsp. morganii]|uniref:Probable membrane transporter protein n=3 Tax=Enterobacterales TaxID=91347 RepID=A0A5U8SUK5_SALET|nr:sulfite exporter TauE/SafE family protein [Morganella morganii]EBR9858980.1 sulfite exporter TauE/SafE family protein [Salmonella enterica subsp. enterica serovar Chester]ELA8472068.1 sulfite exporter TauE/SafE family protein [Morganella morganii]MBA5854575.1 sulfite exporter TauE/SafE family protein [Morganella morganii]MBT0445203.1 sulfite exporter TauE/SafE family protein [Morganella morganii subsp. morganii]MBT0448835.1 sulfite exporter TauE/SafE family protein [Morganella morganii subs